MGVRPGCHIGRPPQCADPRVEMSTSRSETQTAAERERGTRECFSALVGRGFRAHDLPNIGRSWLRAYCALCAVESYELRVTRTGRSTPWTTRRHSNQRRDTGAD
eukprot:4974998-Prymnesium_polylepis.2